MRHVYSRKEAGGALLLSMIALIMMAGIGAALFSLAIAEKKTTLTLSNADAAFHYAEAGIDDAINKMRAYQASSAAALIAVPAPDYAVIGAPVTVDGVLMNQIKGSMKYPGEQGQSLGGTYIATIEPAFAGVGTYKIKSVGECKGEMKGIETWVTATLLDPPFTSGLFGDVYTDTGGNVKTDGYKSSLGTWTSQITGTVKGNQVANKTGHIGSNGNVDISGNSSMIYGNATPGPNDIVTGNTSNVFGSTTPALAPKELPATDYSAPLTAISAPAVTGGTSFGIAGVETVYKVPLVSPSGTSSVVIKGDVTIYVSGDFVFTGQTKLVIEAGASLKIYQNSASGTSKFKINGGSVTNTGKIPADFILYSNATTGVLNGNADFYGTVYAPSTAVAIMGTSGMYGATVAKQIDVQGTPYFHYDEDLALIPSNIVTINVASVENFIPEVTETYEGSASVTK
jgi:hypothetical protein